MKNNKGVTLMLLVVTIVILIIISSVSVFIAIPYMNKVKTSKVLSTMKIIQTKADEIYEEYEFDGNLLAGEKVDEIFIEFFDDEIEIIENNASTDLENMEWYKWDKSVLDKLGIDDAILDNDECFYVNYEYSKIIYSSGIKYENEIYYSLDGINNII